MRALPTLKQQDYGGKIRRSFGRGAEQMSGRVSAKNEFGYDTKIKESMFV